MPLQIQPLQASDFPLMLDFLHSTDGHLSSPAADVAFPTTTDAEAHRRNEWSLAQQHDVLTHDPTATFLKVIDTEKEDAIISIGRWHYYPNGYETSDLEYAGIKPKDAEESYPEGMHTAFYKGILREICERRQEWMVKGPFWVLTTLKTREPERRRDAGGMIVRWGVDKAKQDGCPAYLEAAAAAKSTYVKNGFREVEEAKIDLKPFGIPSEFVVSRMVAE